MESKDADRILIDADDLIVKNTYTEATVEISAVHTPGSIKFSNGKTNDRVVLEFKGKSKKHMPCKTQIRLLKLLLDSYRSSDWVGKSITIYASIVNQFSGGKGPGIRIRPIGVQSKKITDSIKQQIGEDLTGQPYVE